jgi:hypothetical protein
VSTARQRIRVGDSLVNASDLRGLRAAWQGQRLVLFLGAGVSASQGLPSWNKLVLDLLLSHAASTPRWHKLEPHYRRALVKWLHEELGYDPLVLARLVKKSLLEKARRRLGEAPAEHRFWELVRAQLYLDCRSRVASGTLAAVAKLVERAAQGGHLAAIVTFNFDDLLEQELRRRQVAYHVVHGARRATGRGLPIVHVHGYLPQQAPVPEDPNLVFTEDDYHRITEVAFHWAATAIVSYLREHTGLFIGLSMNDPNLRRLLDASRFPKDRPRHWQIQRRHHLGPMERQRVLAQLSAQAEEQRELVGGKSTLSTVELARSLQTALDTANAFDRTVLESMGVKTVWLQSFADMPELLARIPTPGNDRTNVRR